MNVGDVPLNQMDDSLGVPPRPPPSNEHYSSYNNTMNGPVSNLNNLYDRNDTHSPNLSIRSGGSMNRTVTTVTKVTTSHQVHRIGGDSSPLPPDNYSNYNSLTQLHSTGPPTPQRATPTLRTGDGTPTRFYSNPPGNYEPYDSFQPVSVVDSYSPLRNRDIYDSHPNNYEDSSRLNGPQSYNNSPYNDRYNEVPAVDDDRYQRGDDRYHPAGSDVISDRNNYRDLPPSEEDRYRTGPPAERYNNPLYEHAPPHHLPRGDDYPDYPPPTEDRYNNPAFDNQETLPREENLRNLQPDDRYGNGPDDRYGSLHPDDRYGDDRYGSIPPDERYGAVPQDDRYRRTPSPAQGSDRFAGPPGYNDRSPYGSMSHQPYDQEGPRPVYDDQDSRPYDDEVARTTAQHVGAPPDFIEPDSMRRSPSTDSQSRDARWRNPDLPEVIEYLSHPNNPTKANAAAYLQHLCYMDDAIKAKTRGLGGIPVLVEMLSNEIPEVHKNACGALRNLSYGRANDANKKEIQQCGGIPALVRLLRKSPDNDVRELVTGILWNLSSSQGLKKQIIDDGLTVIVNNVIIPHSGWDRNVDDDRRAKDVYWSTVFRNASGILRNVSSDGDYARKKLRECEGLCESILYIVKAAIGKSDIDNKSVENCVCLLRNLSFACQEVEDQDYTKRRQARQQAKPGAGENPGCFGGGGKKKKDPQKVEQRNRSDSGYQSGRQFDPNRPRSDQAKGMDLLWQPDVVHIYLELLSDCSNPETLEAAAGAIQNLAACEWEPSAAIRSTVRKDKGLPIIVELLTIEADRVVCAAATALRNLALDQRNKELIGKYAMRQLVMKLPTDDQRQAPESVPSDNTITAVLATLYEVIKKNPDFAQSLLSEGGVARLVHLTRSRGQYSPKVVKFASTVLYSMWQFKELHAEYKKQGFKEQHFITRTMAARASNSKSPPVSANNTLNRPRMDQSGPVMAGYNESTLPPINRQQNHNHQPSQNSMGYMGDRDGGLPDQGYGGYNDYDDRRDNRPLRHEDIPLNEMGYDTIDSRTGRDDYRPPGGVPMFPNLPPGQQPEPQRRNGSYNPHQSSEPLYAQVDKRKKHQSPYDSNQSSHMRLENPPPEGAGADSWV